MVFQLYDCMQEDPLNKKINKSDRVQMLLRKMPCCDSFSFHKIIHYHNWQYMFFYLTIF